MPSFFRMNRDAESKVAKMARLERDRKARAILERAVASAPVLTGEYRDSLRLESDEDGVRVVAASGHSLLVEARHNTLARALAAERG